MKPLIGKKFDWGIGCDEIGFVFLNLCWYIPNMPFQITGIYSHLAKFNNPSFKVAATDSDEYDYLLLIGNLRTMAADLDKIRKSKKPVIAICDFDFLDDVERYMAAGAQVIVFNKLRRYNG